MVMLRAPISRRQGAQATPEVVGAGSLPPTPRRARRRAVGVRGQLRRPDDRVHDHRLADDVRRLLHAVFERFGDVELWFDAIPPWFSRRTMKGCGRTEHYRAPRTPWEIKRSEIAGTVASWHSNVVSVDSQSYGVLRGPAKLALGLLSNVPVLRDLPPCLVRVRSSSG